MTLGVASALVLSGLIGLSLGLLGSGGSIITMPVLIYVAGVPVANAVGMSLAVVGGTSLVGSALNYRRGNFEPRVAALFALSGMAGAYMGAHLTHLVPPPMLMLIFAGMMLAVGAAMLRSRSHLAPSPSCQPLRCIVAGVAMGVLTGFLGVGGGFLIVPALVLFAGLEMKRAVGTSLAVIAFNCASGLLGQLHYTRFDWNLMLGFLGTATIGMAVGIAGAERLSNRVLRRIFACFIIGVALVLAWHNGHILWDPPPTGSAAIHGGSRHMVHKLWGPAQEAANLVPV